jgi:VIT1/CCC1 family predicted Fe2+/Mn2+ transporter
MQRSGSPKVGVSRSAVSHKQNTGTFSERHLDPASRLGEILFGLIMVLSVTLTAGLSAQEGPEGVRQLLLAALGCNIAWGIIDAAMYVMNGMTARVEKAHFIWAIRAAPDERAALDIVREEIEPRLELLTGPENREFLCRAVLEYLTHADVPPTGVTKEDLYGAMACFWLVFVSCLPAALPFLFFSDPTNALRVSNVLLIGMLFFVGHKWADYAHTNRPLTGLVMMAIGLALVGVAVALGG